jgi:hypothetical protein
MLKLKVWAACAVAVIVKSLAPEEVNIVFIFVDLVWPASTLAAVWPAAGTPRDMPPVKPLMPVVRPGVSPKPIAIALPPKWSLALMVLALIV